MAPNDSNASFPNPETEIPPLEEITLEAGEEYSRRYAIRRGDYILISALEINGETFHFLIQPSEIYGTSLNLYSPRLVRMSRREIHEAYLSVVNEDVDLIFSHARGRSKQRTIKFSIQVRRKNSTTPALLFAIGICLILFSITLSISTKIGLVDSIQVIDALLSIGAIVLQIILIFKIYSQKIPKLKD
jgi:hypothetical protein